MSEQKKRGVWHNAKKEKPDQNDLEIVLVEVRKHESSRLCTAIYFKGQWKEMADAQTYKRDIRNVTYWMYIPVIPKES